MRSKLSPRSSAIAVLAFAASAFAQAPAQNSSATPLPDGDGKDVVHTACVGCHALDRVVNSGYDRAQWTTVLHMMVNVGAKVPPERFDAVADYLAKNFPAKAVPSAVIVRGDLNVSIKEWPVPTPGSRPHDPMYA